MTEKIILELISILQSVPWWQVLLITFFNSYIENIFPPSPSDVILIFIGTMVGVGLIDFPSALLCATLGSILGFITMFLIGRRVDRQVVVTGRYKFIPVDAIHTVERWFKRWGYLVIVVNRFLSGTRAVISFLAGMSEMKLLPSTIYSGVSALVWNALVLYGGVQMGKNWREIESFLETYSEVVGGLICVALIVIVVRQIVKRRKVATKSE